MKLFKRANFLLICLVLSVGLAMASCDNTYHVFDEIQTEVKQTGTDVFKNTTVKALADDGTNYYAAMAKIWYRPIAGETWNVLPIKDGTSERSDYIAYSLVSGTGGAIYVGVELDSLAVYKASFAAGTWTWTAIPLGSLASNNLDALFFANGKLFALAHGGSGNSLRYSLHYSDGSAAFAATGLADLELSVLGLGHDGTDYFVATSAKIYSSASETGAWSDSSPATDKTYGGLTVDHANNVQASTSDGYLYTHTKSDGAWSAAAEIKKGQKLGMIADVKVSTGTYRLLIAHENSGYYECDTSANPVTVIEGGDKNTAFDTVSTAYTTAISGKAVLAIHSSSTGSGLLIGLASQGSSTGYALYSNPLSLGTWSGWTAE